MTVPDVSQAVRYCGAPTREGGTCRQVIALDSASGLCIHHDPAKGEEAQAMRRRGAAAANAREPQPDDAPPPPEPQTLEDVVRWHSWIAVALARGQIGKAEATGLAYNLQQLRGALVSRDLEREVRELRAAIAALKKQGNR